MKYEIGALDEVAEGERINMKGNAGLNAVTVDSCAFSYFILIRSLRDLMRAAHISDFVFLGPR
jgi:hypothetical protein